MGRLGTQRTNGASPGGLHEGIGAKPYEAMINYDVKPKAVIGAHLSCPHLSCLHSFSASATAKDLWDTLQDPFNQSRTRYVGSPCAAS
jgi:hypothetical protein